MNVILELWKHQKLPIKNGIYFRDEKSYIIKLKSSEDFHISGIYEFDLQTFYSSDPEWVTHIDITKEERLQQGGYFCSGEGASGAEGFFARLNSERDLLWVVYLEESNPFCNFTFKSNIAIVESTSGLKIELDINDPKTLKIV